MMSFVGSVKNIEMHSDKTHISEQDFKAKRKRDQQGKLWGSFGWW